MCFKGVDQFIDAIGVSMQTGRQTCRAALKDHGIDHARPALRKERQHSDSRSRWIAILLACAAVLQPNALLADTIPVRHTEGLMHGFLVLRTLDGKAIADGQMTQDARGDRVNTHLIFRFKDGSLYEDTAVYSQRGTFRLLSDHLIQKGPSFKQPVDTFIDASTGQVKVRYTEEGKEKIVAQRLELPPDAANGLLFTLVKDLNPKVS